ncbi:MAG: Mediator of RNA polymerase II transcription subunit 7 [Vezdaea acicularis]|nr:MAG: Mediator of RNA polymerase II transcription subunit 7 [Vezdaea acicularis]
MADPPPASISAAFPAPPPFYKYFTPQNLSQLAELRSSEHETEKPTSPPSAATATATTAIASSSTSILELPPDLRYLVPPDPPVEHYRSFGGNYEINEPPQTLSSQGLSQLYPAPPPSPSPSSSPTTSTTTPSHHRAAALKTLTKSLLLSYLELLSLLSTNPAHYTDKLDHLRTLFVNCHFLINEYRPHQARESLIVLMEEAVRRGREEVAGVKEARERVARVVAGIVGGQGLEGGKQESAESVEGWTERDTTARQSADEDRDAQLEKEVWRVLDAEIGV